MKSYKVLLKDQSPPDELERAKRYVTDNGGSIDAELALIKGFSAQLPESIDFVSNRHIDVLEE